MGFNRHIIWKKQNLSFEGQPNANVYKINIANIPIPILQLIAMRLCN